MAAFTVPQLRAVAIALSIAASALCWSACSQPRPGKGENGTPSASEAASQPGQAAVGMNAAPMPVGGAAGSARPAPVDAGVAKVADDAAAATAPAVDGAAATMPPPVMPARDAASDDAAPPDAELPTCEALYGDCPSEAFSCPGALGGPPPHCRCMNGTFCLCLTERCTDTHFGPGFPPMTVTRGPNSRFHCYHAAEPLPACPGDEHCEPGAPECVAEYPFPETTGSAGPLLINSDCIKQSVWSCGTNRLREPLP